MSKIKFRLNKTNFVWLFFLFLLLWFYAMQSVLLAFLGGILLTYLLYPLVRYLEKRRRMKRIAAIMLTYLAVFLALLFIFLYLLPIIHGELNQLVNDLPRYFAALRELVDFYDLWPTLRLSLLSQEFLSRMEGILMQLVQGMAGAIAWAVTSLINIVLAFALSFYLLRDYDLLLKEFIELFPAVKRYKVGRFISDVGTAVQGFVSGQLAVAVFLSLCISVGLYFLDISYALLIGVMAGFLGIIPYLGPIAGAVPAVFLALFSSPFKAVQVILLFFLLNQIEGNIISPRIVGSKVGLHPLLVILAIMIGGKVMGIAGMLLAVPLAAVVRITFLYIWSSLPDG